MLRNQLLDNKVRTVHRGQARPLLNPWTRTRAGLSTSASLEMAKPLSPRNIWGVGKNYLLHIKELKGMLNIDQDIPQEPLIFLKSSGTLAPYPGTSLTPLPTLASTVAEVKGLPPIPLPLPTHWSSDIQHEVELAIELGSDLSPSRMAVSIDMTARDVQFALKTKGHPWTLAKSFPYSCPVGPPCPLPPPPSPSLPTRSESLKTFRAEGRVEESVQGQGATGIGMDVELVLEVNGVERQRSSTSEMIFKVEELVIYLKSRYPLQPGDLILTGTPEGVGKLVPGDVVRAWVAGEGGKKVLSGGAWKCTGPEV